jgi:MerR family copper efflux transcriptional regulator
MRIGALAHTAGLNATAVRYYESIGLIPEPDRTASGYRDYGDDALERLRFVRDSQAAGLTLAETREILDMKASGESTCEHTRALVDRHLVEIDAQISSLLAAKAELTALADRADSLDPANCCDPHKCQVIALDIQADSKV